MAGGRIECRLPPPGGSVAGVEVESVGYTRRVGGCRGCLHQEGRWLG